jgi:hypothetical protein
MRWLRAKCPRRIPLRAAHFEQSELSCVLLVTELLVLRAGQRGKCHQVLDLGLRQSQRLDVLVEPWVTYSVPLVVVV